ncbi:MAG: 2-dehydropantoate 2-reductase [Deltaproteobacteria bacterium]|nr:2-dehydropantoate 2-reductase [Deltaproteobacteria bacterium]
MLHYGIIGMGPIGSVLAAHLLKAGQRVSALCYDQAMLDLFTSAPITVSGNISVTAKVNDLYLDLKKFIETKPDVIIIATKTCHSAPLVQQIKRECPHKDTVFLACQNGIDVEEQLVNAFGPHHALRMVLNLGCNDLGNNNIRVHFAMTHYLSKIKCVDPNIIKKIAGHFNTAGFTTEIKEDYRAYVFKKALLNSSIGTVCALTRMTMQEVLDEPDLERMVKQMVREGIWVAQAEKLDISMSYLDEAMTYLKKGGNHKPSILIDIEMNRATENDYHCGKIFNFAEKHNIEVAVTQTIYYLMKNLEQNVTGRLKRSKQ